MIDLVVVGNFGRPYGVKGAIHINAYTDSLENFMQYSCFYIKNKDDWKELNLYEKSLHNNGLICKVQGYADRTAVAVLTNKEIAIPKSLLKKLAADEYYWHDIIDLNVYNKDNCLLGTVKEVIRTGANDVLMIQGENLYLIPYVKTYISQVDIERKKIVVDWDINDADDRLN